MLPDFVGSTKNLQKGLKKLTFGPKSLDLEESWKVLGIWYMTIFIYILSLIPYLSWCLHSKHDPIEVVQCLNELARMITKLQLIEKPLNKVKYERIQRCFKLSHLKLRLSKDDKQLFNRV